MSCEQLEIPDIVTWTTSPHLGGIIGEYSRRDPSRDIVCSCFKFERAAEIDLVAVICNHAALPTDPVEMRILNIRDKTP